MRQSSEKNNKRKIQFKIAGQGTALEGLKAMVEKYELWEDVIFLGNIGAGEIIIVALVILLLFGGKKIPELMKGLGKGVRSFKDGINDIEKEINAEPQKKNETSSEE